MRKASFKVDIQPLGWGTLSQHRNNRGPVDKGGWSLFARGSPTRSRCGRIRSCRTSTAASGSSSRLCGRTSRGWGRRRCRCWRWRWFELDRRQRRCTSVAFRTSPVVACRSKPLAISTGGPAGPIGGSARRSQRGQCVMCGSLRSPEGEPPACPGWGPGPPSVQCKIPLGRIKNDAGVINTFERIVLLVS
jgi:hypothetical protein